MSEAKLFEMDNIRNGFFLNQTTPIAKDIYQCLECTKSVH